VIGLTPRQRELLAYLSERELCPSYAEIGNALGIGHKSAVISLLNGLEERGYIRRLKNRARAIEVLHPAKPLRLKVVFGPDYFEALANITRTRPLSKLTGG
jgi:SOS-response transcriptional repressor LexA